MQRIVVPVDAQTPSNPTYTTPSVNLAVNEAVERQRAIREAHAENMAANVRLVAAVDVLAVSIDTLETAADHLTAAINKIAKWLIDDAMANRGLKL